MALNLMRFFNKKKIINKSINIKNITEAGFSLLDKKFNNTGDSGRSNLKSLQIMTAGFVVSMVGNIFLVALIIILLPLKEKVPYFVHFLPKNEQIVYVEQYKNSKKSIRAIKEFLARDYVYKRETIDLVSETDRYTKLTFLSSEKVAKEFLENYHPEKNPNSPFKLASEGKYIRFINIISSSVLNDDQIQIEFEYRHSKKASGIIIEEGVAIATVSFIEDKTALKGENYLNNPFGWLIDDYSVGIKRFKKNDNTEDVFNNNTKDKKNDLPTSTY